MRSLPEWLSYLETLHYKSIELGLTRVRTVAEKLGLSAQPTSPQSCCPVIMVGGTNGKGSTVTYIASILNAAGYKTGVYTSPHLLRFNERILIQEEMVSDSELIEAFEEVESVRGDITLTYFEFTTLAALWLFQKAKLDVIVLEVGLGGRLDAVNIVDPDVSVITSIDLDHMEYLGNTREAIGYEKAGIFRTGKPAICGDPDPPDSVLNQAVKLNVPLYCVGRDFSYAQRDSESWEMVYPSPDTQNVSTSPTRGEVKGPLPMPVLPLQNAATALMALQCLKDKFHIDDDAIKKGLLNAFLPGRVQYFQIEGVNIWVDVAHNPAAAEYLHNVIIASAMSLREFHPINLMGKYEERPRYPMHALTQKLELQPSLNGASPLPTGRGTGRGGYKYIPSRKRGKATAGARAVKMTRAVVGMLSDKDILETLRPMLPIVDSWYVAGLESVPRGASANVIANHLQALGVSQYHLHQSVEAAFKHALSNSKLQDNMIVFGSFHTVGPVLEWINRMKEGI